jgi:hypothetical protein
VVILIWRVSSLLAFSPLQAAASRCPLLQLVTGTLNRPATFGNVPDALD